MKKSYRVCAGGKTYNFRSLREVMAKASPERSGDVLAGIAAADYQERVAAQICLADVPLSAEGNWDVDMQTCEARAYAVARKFEPLLVNTVVGFIGPEYLYDGKQIIRAGLEDHFCAKLLGLPMGCDICYTNHAEADQNDMDNLLTLLAAAGLNYIMGIPGCDDIMLGYQTTSFHDVLYARQLFGLRPEPEFEAWLEKMEIFGNNKLLPAGRNNKFLTSYESSID